MQDPGDYFFTAQAATSHSLVESDVVEPGVDRPMATGAAKRPAPRRIVATLLVIATVGAGAVVMGLPGASAARHTVDTRPIAIPSSILGRELKTDDYAQQHAQSMMPILKKIFGANASASAQYSIGDVNLLTGRGPIDRASTGDVHTAARERSHFGDITCAYMQYKKAVLDNVTICWYSSPTFGASLLVVGKANSDMSSIAQALDGAVPGMRGDGT